MQGGHWNVSYTSILEDFTNVDARFISSIDDGRSRSDHSHFNLLELSH